MVASKTTDAAKLVLRLPKHLHKQLKQRARRNGVSLNTEIVNELERHHDYTVPLTEIGLFSPEFARERSRGGHPPLSIGEALELWQKSKAAGMTPEEYFRRELEKRGDPDAPYEGRPAVAATGT